MSDSAEFYVARGRSLMIDGVSRGPGAVLPFQPPKPRPINIFPPFRDLTPAQAITELSAVIQECGSMIAEYAAMTQR
jgi:hypothetical protein